MYWYKLTHKTSFNSPMITVTNPQVELQNDQLSSESAFIKAPATVQLAQ